MRRPSHTAATASGVPIVRKWKAAIVLLVIGCSTFKRHLRRAGTGGVVDVEVIVPFVYRGPTLSDSYFLTHNSREILPDVKFLEI
jgi:hypothetical protein